MLTTPKIKLIDNDQLRLEIDSLYSNTNQIILAKWSISVAKKILTMSGIDYKSVSDINEGFQVNENWQLNKATVQDVRQASFKIHKLAREMDNETKKNALRVTGHAIASGHMKEHAMVASDYAIKVVDLLYSNDINEITKERKWQLAELHKFINNENF